MKAGIALEAIKGPKNPGNRVSMDNIFIERLWRTVKDEEIDLKDDLDVEEAIANLKSYFGFYNHQRPHQGIGVSNTRRRSTSDCGRHDEQNNSAVCWEPGRIAIVAHKRS